MKTIIYNNDSLTEEEINRRVIRVKALIINSKSELLIGYSHDTYQFVGGHIEENEDLIEGLIREVEEEAGIRLKKEEIQPFFLRKKYLRNYPKESDNSCYEYYYYVVYSNRLPDLTKVNYTESEIIGRFELRYISLNELEKELEENKKVSEATKIVEEENLEAISIYKELYNM